MVQIWRTLIYSNVTFKHKSELGLATSIQTLLPAKDIIVTLSLGPVKHELGQEFSKAQ